ncbi:hypothetical protein Aph01nite_59100 [Acrocarpospora phusangensis]|uniref:DUF6879 domain-containing protein n=1 Tax=Acrocarpospora phusangensis TaxID=1070424 RepID=A0A919QHP7_9ACTN|nr:DUF6879 family protein [Acrocarpospora phusangensis]GIH27600.1 hypothetical protein Aph01nite_59100 [Acrocarpospora phusangensis]
MILTLTELFAKAHSSVTHLELRDTYGSGGPGYRAWREGASLEDAARIDEPFVAPWVALVRSTTERGITFRRARVISEPVTGYIRFEHAATGYSNLAGGEQVRWLPRPQAKDIPMPACDFWQIDDGLICWVFQDGDGGPNGYELSEYPAQVKLCSAAFEAVWERALDHSEYEPA